MRGPLFKVCSSCGEIHPATNEFFYRQGPGNGNPPLRANCRVCDLAYKRKYRKDHPVRMAVRERAYLLSHREEVAAKNKRYKQANHEAVAATWRGQRARRKSAPGSHTAADVRDQYKRQRGRCFWCPKKVGKAYHVDHVIPLSLGGSNGPENIVIACPACNREKSATHPMDFAGVML